MSTLFPPEYFAALARLGRRAQRTGAGMAAAQDAGRQVRGHQHRAYAPGDAIQDVDWRASARTRDTLVRQREQDRGGEVLIWLDRSASLCPAHDRRDQDQRRLALALGWVALEEGARVRLQAGAQTHELAQAHRRPQLQRSLEQLPAVDRTASAAAPRLRGGRRGRQSWLLTDPWLDSACWDELGALAQRGNEVHLVVLTLPEEAQPPAGPLGLRSAESDERLDVDLTGRGPEYQAAWRRHLQQLQLRAQGIGVHVHFVACGSRADAATVVLRTAQEAGVV